MSSYRKIAITLPLLLFMSCEVVDTYVEELHDVDEQTEETHIEGENHDDKSILEITAEKDEFSIFTEALAFTGIVADLDGNRQYTVFAPTNDAFSGLLENLELTVDEFFVDENKELIIDILLYHIAPGNRPAQSIESSDRINTLHKSFLFIQNSGGNILVGNSENGFANITDADIEVSNGIIHMIDRVLVP